MTSAKAASSKRVAITENPATAPWLAQKPDQNSRKGLGGAPVDFETKDSASAAPPGLMPWFEVPGRRTAGVPIAFGHWSTLGLIERPDLLSLDTGCVWGGQLTAVCVDNGERDVIQIQCMQQPVGRLARCCGPQYFDPRQCQMRRRPVFREAQWIEYIEAARAAEGQTTVAQVRVGAEVELLALQAVFAVVGLQDAGRRIETY